MIQRIVLFLLCVWCFGAGAQVPLSFKGLPLGASESEVTKKYTKLRCVGDEAARSCYFYRDAHHASAAARIMENCFKEKIGSANDCLALGEVQSGGDTIAGYVVLHMNFRFLGGELSAISLHIHANGFLSLSVAIGDVYGRPASDTTSIISNRAGAKFEDRTVIWSSDAGQIVLRRYGAGLDTSTVRFSNAADAANRATEEAVRRKKAAGDL